MVRHLAPRKVVGKPRDSRPRPHYYAAGLLPQSAGRDGPEHERQNPEPLAVGWTQIGTYGRVPPTRR